MKKIIFTLIFCAFMYQVPAQTTVTISGKIENSNTDEQIYLRVDSFLIPVTPSDKGSFSANADLKQLPSFFYFVTISKRGKINQQTPRIWFDNASVTFNIDWSDKSFLMQDQISFQSTSEKIESLKGTEQIEFILKEPNSIPKLYFADELKESFAVADLEKLSQDLANDYKESAQLKRIENYVSAKKRTPVKEGNTIEDFSLPDSDGKQISIIGTEAKPKLIAVFSSGCSYSIASISLLEQLAELNNTGLEIITIWQDTSKDSFLNEHAEEKMKITWTNLWDEYSFGATYLDNNSWPTFYAVSADGILTDKFHGYSKKTAKKLKQLIE